MRTRTLAALLAACLWLAANAPSVAAPRDEAGVMSEYTVELSGVCPGYVILSWSGATPNRRQGVVYGREEGKFIIPVNPCQGTVLGVTRQVELFVILETRDGKGTVIAYGGEACGGYIQLVEGGTCRTSNVVPMPR